jgi:hypothetical protein
MIANCGCGRRLQDVKQILEHFKESRHVIVIRGLLTSETIRKHPSFLDELQVLAVSGSFHAACGCGFVSSSPQKSLEHAMKGHTVNWILRLSRKASARRSRKILAPATLNGAAEGEKKGGEEKNERI